MTDFLIGTAMVLVGAFAMFLVARRALTPAMVENPGAWLALIAGMCFAVFLIHRLLGQGVSVPAYTVAFFAIVIGASDANYSEGVAELVAPVAKKGRWAAIAGGLVGWLVYAEIIGQ